MATMALESMPPERNAPRGTSEIMRMRTDSSSRAEKLVPGGGKAAGAFGRRHVPILAQLTALPFS